MRTRQTNGFSLVELLVSMVIGLVIALAAVNAYVGVSGASHVAEAQGRMNEDAQMALSILSQQIKMAGANPAQPNRPNGSQRNPLQNLYGVRGCDATFSNVTSAATATALTCGHTSSSTGPASISIGYEADKFNTLVVSGKPSDCMGSALTATATTATTYTTTGTTTSNISVYEAENRFYVGTTTAIVNPSLYCKGNATTAQPLVENIVDLQITYGVFNPGSTPGGASPTAVLGYLSAYNVENDSGNLKRPVTLVDMPTGATTERWDAVATARVCVVVRSAEPVAPNAESAKYYNCAGTLTSASDQYLRRAYTTTVVLRNNQ